MAFQAPIFNPSIPFSGYISGGLSPGRTVTVQGQIPLGARRFAVNLRCGSGDLALHVNPRFDEAPPVLVCNAQQAGAWGAEQRRPAPPLAPGACFEIALHAQARGYQVSVNGQPVLEFVHRLPLHTVQTLEVTGDVTVTCISFAGPLFTMTLAQPLLGAAPDARVVVSNPSVPFHAALPRTPSAQPRPITIVGSVLPHANRFHVNLRSSVSGSVVLHVNPRLREGALVRNTQRHGRWGTEERHAAAMPFAAGQPFQMEIRTLSHGYRVAVNGQHVFDYSHRLPPGEVDQLEISGDVSLACVQY
ncbi:galectin-4-like isoform X2 [Dromaius novaehollandiae]|uniref:galectin-4-like isoform X2 n=1 Tax=Dromaius novaehollandiae TaxID=8790 RepID=UPI00311E9BDD